MIIKKRVYILKVMQHVGQFIVSSIRYNFNNRYIPILISFKIDIFKLEDIHNSIAQDNFLNLIYCLM
jgi:hypothetical protein